MTMTFEVDEFLQTGKSEVIAEPIDLPMSQTRMRGSPRRWPR